MKRIFFLLLFIPSFCFSQHLWQFPSAYKLTGHEFVYISQGDTTKKTRVDSLRDIITFYRIPGKDSLYLTINGITYAVLDSIGSGGGSGVTNVTAGLWMNFSTITSTGSVIADSAVIAGYMVRRKDSTITFVTPHQLASYLNTSTVLFHSGLWLTGGDVVAGGNEGVDSAGAAGYFPRLKDSTRTYQSYYQGNLRMKYSDTASLVLPYLLQSLAASTYATITNLALKKANNDSTTNTGYASIYQNSLKQNSITTGTTSQYFRGDLSLATFPTNNTSFTNGAGYLTANQAITLTGPVTGSGTTTIATTIGAGVITNPMLGADSAFTINGTLIYLGSTKTITAAGNTLTGSSLASGITTSSLTSFGNSPTFITPILGTPTSGNLTNCTGITKFGAQTDYSGTSTIVGWTSFTTKTIDYVYDATSKILMVNYTLSGTSNSVSCSFTLPQTPNQTFRVLIAQSVNNGVTPSTVGWAQITLGSTTFAMSPNQTTGATNWTAANTKTVSGTVMIMCQ